VQCRINRKREGWPNCQDSQRRTLGLRNTGMAITIDIGIQRTFIRRTKSMSAPMARVARGNRVWRADYLLWSLFRRRRVKAARLRVWFDQTGGSLKTKDDGAVKAF